VFLTWHLAGSLPRHRYTAREANRILDRTGEAFWQEESYDHWVRDELEWGRIAKDIENNPVGAGLAAKPEDCPWSSGADLATHSTAAVSGEHFEALLTEVAVEAESGADSIVPHDLKTHAIHQAEFLP
jgi:hypothetical protein